MGAAGSVALHREDLDLRFVLLHATDGGPGLARLYHAAWKRSAPDRLNSRRVADGLEPFDATVVFHPRGVPDEQIACTIDQRPVLPLIRPPSRPTAPSRPPSGQRAMTAAGTRRPAKATWSRPGPSSFGRSRPGRSVRRALSPDPEVAKVGADHATAVIRSATPARRSAHSGLANNAYARELSIRWRRQPRYAPSRPFTAPRVCAIWAADRWRRATREHS
jgi:hypothetical protein